MPMPRPCCAHAVPVLCTLRPQELAEAGALCVSYEYVVDWLAQPWSSLARHVLLHPPAGADNTALDAERRRGSEDGEVGGRRALHAVGFLRSGPSRLSAAQFGAQTVGVRLDWPLRSEPDRISAGGLEDCPAWLHLPVGVAATPRALLAAPLHAEFPCAPSSLSAGARPGGAGGAIPRVLARHAGAAGPAASITTWALVQTGAAAVKLPQPG